MTIVVQHFAKYTDEVLGTEAERLLIHCIQDQDKGISLITEAINRALNCWPDAPKDLKDLGDMLTHRRITQDHSYSRINTLQNTDYYTPAEQEKIRTFIAEIGEPKWIEMLSSGEAVKEIAKRLK